MWDSRHSFPRTDRQTFSEHFRGLDTKVWSEWQAIYEFPEMSDRNPRRDPDTWCYAAKEHIEFAQAGALLVTYACNSFKFEKQIANTDIYRPQVVSVRLPAPIK